MAIVDFDIVAATKLAETISGAKAYQADVTKSSDMDGVVARIVADFGSLDGAVKPRIFLAVFPMLSEA